LPKPKGDHKELELDDSQVESTQGFWDGQAPFAVLWDLDGTLVDTGELHYESWKVVFDPLGVQFSRDDFKKTFGMTSPAVLKLELGENTPGEKIEQLAHEKEAAFRELIPGHLKVFPGVREWLERLSQAGIPMAVASSAPMKNIDTLVDEVHIRSYFQALVSSAGLPSKPDPAVFLKAAKQLEMPPEKCVVVEDAGVGVQAAKRAGMGAIGVTSTHPRDTLEAADIVVDSLADLPRDIFERLTQE
jgi:beta-phosphoglucomutase